MNFLTFCAFFVCAGSAAWCRFTFDAWAKAQRVGTIPWGTFCINVMGSFLLGTLTGAAGLLAQQWGSEAARVLALLLGTGFLGGFTTFSTAMVESVKSLRAGALGHAGILWLAQACVSMLAASCGLMLFS